MNSGGAARESSPDDHSGIDGARLHRVLGDENLDWLVRRVRTRLERGISLDGTVTLDGATTEQRRAVGRLLGRPVGRGTSLSVSLPALEDALRRASLAPDLRSAIVELTGPIRDRAAEQAEAQRAWNHALEPALTAAGPRPALAPWVQWLSQTGVLRSLAEGDPARGRDLIVSAVAVLDRLPAEGVPLSVLSAQAIGDGHALDPGRPLATLVLRAAAELGDVPPGDTAEDRRTVWAAVGVLHGELTNPVLTFNLPGDPETVTGQALGMWAGAGQPVHLSARQLLRDPPELDLGGGRDVFVCENPVVVAAAADRPGTASAPLVCASSQPGAAATLLLRMLTARSALLHYHGDFDWPGLAMAAGIIDRFAARPWRMGAEDYRRGARDDARLLRGASVTASWDADLEPAMRAYGVAVEEEAVLDDLLTDLAGD